MKKLILFSFLFAVTGSSHAANSLSAPLNKPSDYRLALISEYPNPNDPALEELFDYFRKNVKYPTELRRDNVQTHMVVFVQVDDSGKGSVVEIIGENHEGFSGQIIALIEKYPNKWGESYFGKKVGMPFIFQKHKGKEIVPPSLKNASFDELLTPITVTGYDAVR
ncbi:hypothetical protein [Mariniradius sediminis]|jgi:hypothetical protein|uniref:TonB protein C-terminal n=1 Tax=Mariniradius sediminis TaxID=2909237 RepID=A0ABS9C0S5_9BACT|nr:hypothetical protein [Mariniradius sediminis]MCF1753155.1 hypothetical protein [Mariniradius sediminis]